MVEHHKKVLETTGGKVSLEVRAGSMTDFPATELRESLLSEGLHEATDIVGQFFIPETLKFQY